MDDTNDKAVDRRVDVPLPRININEPVTPGHDMVVNHIDGSQELAQGNVAAAIQAQEAKDPSKVVSVADAKAGPADENPRTPDPETNGPDQQVSGKTADVVVADSQPDVNPNDVTPAFPTPPEGEDAVEVNSPTKTDAVKNSEVVFNASAEAQDKANGDAKEEAGKAPAKADATEEPSTDVEA